MNETIYSEDCIFYPNGSIEYRNSTIDDDYFNEKKNCVPFHESFLSCWKWKFSSDELFYNTTTRSWTYNLSSQEYKPGNYNMTSADHSVVVCIPLTLYPEYFYFDGIFVILSIFSILCLMAAFHLHLKSSRNSKINHYDVKPMLCHMTCLSMIYVTDAVFITRFSIETAAKWQILALAFQIGALISTLTWLNVITFDMWNQFRPKYEMIQIEHTGKGFACRCLYAFSIPLLIIIIIIVPRILMSSVNSVLADPAGVRNDWLIQIFFLGSDALLNSVNLVFCVLTMINVRKARKSVENVINSCRRNRSMLRIGMYVWIISGFSIMCGLIAHFLREINFLLPILPDMIMELQARCGTTEKSVMISKDNLCQAAFHEQPV
uniref:G-protein coupled receptors family 1 profile domain-containing protein n=1 Tax=Strigamia maritima TaxID=126957 RepID=T1IXL9_STRMM